MQLSDVQFLSSISEKPRPEADPLPTVRGVRAAWTGDLDLIDCAVAMASPSA
jgi:hypothetical protein